MKKFASEISSLIEAQAGEFCQSVTIISEKLISVLTDADNLNLLHASLKKVGFSYLGYIVLDKPETWCIVHSYTIDYRIFTEVSYEIPKGFKPQTDDEFLATRKDFYDEFLPDEIKDTQNKNNAEGLFVWKTSDIIDYAAFQRQMTIKKL
jgi:DNA modification methylase